MRFRPTLALALLSVASCTSASGDVVGGGPRDGYDPTLPAVVEPTYLNAPKLSWTGIYRDFFSRRALSSCAGRTSCHADATGLGAKGSNFICADKKSCWDTMRHQINVDPNVSRVPLIADSDIAAPENAYLFKVVRLITNDGVQHHNLEMPKVPSDFYFKPDDIDRMQTWIRNGALND
jgi:hypothetical protein